MTEHEVRSLSGGWVYLHEASTQRGYATYRVVGEPRPGQGPWAGKYGLVLQKQRSNRAPAWRPHGDLAGQNPRHYFRIVDADLPHERY